MVPLAQLLDLLLVVCLATSLADGCLIGCRSSKVQAKTKGGVVRGYEGGSVEEDVNKKLLKKMMLEY